MIDGTSNKSLQLCGKVVFLLSFSCLVTQKLEGNWVFTEHDDFQFVFNVFYLHLWSHLVPPEHVHHHGLHDHHCVQFTYSTQTVMSECKTADRGQDSNNIIQPNILLKIKTRSYSLVIWARIFSNKYETIHPNNVWFLFPFNCLSKVNTIIALQLLYCAYDILESDYF